VLQPLAVVVDWEVERARGGEGRVVEEGGEGTEEKGKYVVLVMDASEDWVEK
jgi:hypothetical protein